MRPREMLRTKFHCHVIDKETVDVVMELSAGKAPAKVANPSRYVLVIDVSKSMDGNVESENPETLLDRVKVFARLVIQNTSETDSLSIVTFSNDVQVDVPMSLMDKKGKKKAENAVKLIHTRRATNLEIGVLEALEELKRDESTGKRDMLIVFTDGLANRGEKDPSALAQKYREIQCGLAHSVPLSGFTIGEFNPFLLKELTFKLGTEAFYWLNKGREFEADMLLPVFLRAETNVTDVTIEIKCLQNLQFSLEDIHEKNLTESTDISLQYLMHGIPKTVSKHIPLKLALPDGKFERMQGKDILAVSLSFMDNQMNRQEFTEHVVLASTADTESSFIVENGAVLSSPSDSKLSFFEIAEQKFRSITVGALKNASSCLLVKDKSTQDQYPKIIADAILEIHKTKRDYRSVMGSEGPMVTKLMECASEWVSHLEFAKQLQDKKMIGRLYAMQSSLACEMPTARGVFDDQQRHPYMHWQMSNKLRKFEKMSKKVKKGKVTLVATDGKTLILSESLRHEKFGWNQESLEDLLARCGGTVGYEIFSSPYKDPPPWYKPRTYPNTYLITSEEDYQKKTYLVRQAITAEIPVLKEKFVFQSIKKKKLLEVDDFRFEAS